MAIKAFKRISNYFSGFEKLQADKLDGQFNMIVDYINNEVVATLGRLNDTRVAGSDNPALINSFLENVGDGTTRWSNISNNNFEDFSISLEKFSRINAGSIIAANEQGVLQALKPTADYQVLVSRQNAEPVWQKLTSEQLEDRTITGDKVQEGSLTNTNLPAHLIDTLIIDNSITGDKFADRAINASKIADSTLTAAKLTPDLRTEFASTVWSHTIPNGYLSNLSSILKHPTGPHLEYDSFIRLFNDPTRLVRYNTQGKPTINTVMPAVKFTSTSHNTTKYFGFCAHHVFGKVQAVAKLKENSIDAVRVAIEYIENSPNDFRAKVRRRISQLVEDNAVTIEHLDPYLRSKIEAVQ